MHYYRMGGLAVACDINLPPVVTASPGDAPPDVTIRRSTVPEALEDATDKGPTWQIAEGRFLLRVPGVVRFLLSEGRDVAYEPEGDTSPADIAIFLAGTVFGVLLHQRGQIVLHASAVRVGDRAVLFCGVSGAGKSTLAAALGQRGYALLNDDVCAIGLDSDGAPVAHSDGRQLKLWAQAINNLDLAARRGAAVRTNFDKFYVDPAEAFSAPLPLGAVYTLRETRASLVDGIERPNVVDAALLIRKNAYRPYMVNAMRMKPQYFQSAANIVSKAGSFLLTRPLDFARMPDVVQWLELHWAELGLLEPVDG